MVGPGNSWWRAEVISRYVEGVRHLRKQGARMSFVLGDLERWLEGVESPEALARDHPAFLALTQGMERHLMFGVSSQVSPGIPMPEWLRAEYVTVCLGYKAAPSMEMAAPISFSQLMGQVYNSPEMQEKMLEAVTQENAFLKYVRGKGKR